MNKSQFLDEVRRRLAGFSQADIDRFLDYCQEMIDDRMEDGLSEEEAVAVLGSPEDVVSQLLMDSPVRQESGSERPAGTLKAWQIAVLALSSPIWIPLVFSLVMTVVGLGIGIVATALGLYCAAGGLILGGAAMLVAGPVKYMLPDLLFLLAAGALLVGIGLLMILALNGFVRVLIRLVKWAGSKIRPMFLKKEEKT